jgi:hypothetical protein
MSEQQQTSTESRSKRNFIYAIKTGATKRAYEMGINGFMKFLGIEKGDYDKLLEYDSKVYRVSYSGLYHIRKGLGKS